MKRPRQVADEPRLFDFPLDAPVPREEPESVDAVDEPPAVAEPRSLFVEAEPATAEPDAPAAPVPAEPDLAGIVPRLRAALVDLGLTFGVLIAMLAGLAFSGVPLRFAAWPAVLVFLLAFSFLYHVLPLAFWGRSPGMAAVGLQARTGQDQPLEFRQVVLRWVGTLVTVAGLGLPGLLGLTGRSLADRLSGSVTYLRRRA